jgi:hypothetical protein
VRRGPERMRRKKEEEERGGEETDYMMLKMRAMETTKRTRPYKEEMGSKMGVNMCTHAAVSVVIFEKRAISLRKEGEPSLDLLTGGLYLVCAGLVIQ